MKQNLIKSVLDIIYHTGAYHALAPATQGMGLIFTLHHIRPLKEEYNHSNFHPNGILEITPDFLDATIERLKFLDIDLVSLDEAVRRVQSGHSERRFACFTIDDGYHDNFLFAWSVFKKHECPFTVFVTPGIIDGTCELWWLALEKIIAQNRSIEFVIDDKTYKCACNSLAEKKAAFEETYWPIRNMDEYKQRRFITELCDTYKIDLEDLCRWEAMTWDELRALNEDPLVTIGAHTNNHFALAKLTEKQALEEMTSSAKRLETEIGNYPEYFCYPYGDEGSAGEREFKLAQKAGFKAATTTRKGVVFSEHNAHLTALPRVSLNGDYQSIKYIDLFASGVPFALWNKFKKVSAA